MSLRTPDLLFTAIAPAIWGGAIVTTQYLPDLADRSDAAGVAGGFIAHDNSTNGPAM
ncbi:hypothetical protein P1U16_23290 [Escherichia coli]